MAKTRVQSVERVIGSRIKMYRRRAHLSQTALGKHLGVTFQQIQKYENGTNRLSAATLFSIARFLHISANELTTLDRDAPAAKNKEIARFAKTAEARSLLRAYLAISNVSLRNHVLGLVQTLGR
jgi:transcriptional regulator with XRE-family HTH domain